MYPYAYLEWNLIFFAVWLLIFVTRPRVRREMLLFSFVGALLGPVAGYFYAFDYFRPEHLFGGVVGIEELLNGFVNGGVAAGLYEFVRLDRGVRPSRPGLWKYGVLTYALGALWMHVGIVTLGFPSLWVFLALFFALAFVLLSLRPRLWHNALWSGVLFMSFHTVFYIWFFATHPGILEAWWVTDALLGVYPFGVPLEEILWTFAWGLVAGPGSELCARLRLPRDLEHMLKPYVS